MSREETMKTHTGTVFDIEISADRTSGAPTTYAVVRGGQSLGGGAAVSSGERDGSGRQDAS